MTSSNYVFLSEEDENLGVLYAMGHQSLIAVEAKAKLKSLDYAGILIAYDDSVERLVDVLDSNIIFSRPSAITFVFETREN